MCRLILHLCQNYPQCQVYFRHGFEQMCYSQNNTDPQQLRHDRAPGFCGEGVEPYWYTDGSYCIACGARRAQSRYFEIAFLRDTRRSQRVSDVEENVIENILSRNDEEFAEAERAAERGKCNEYIHMNRFTESTSRSRNHPAAPSAADKTGCAGTVGSTVRTTTSFASDDAFRPAVACCPAG